MDDEGVADGGMKSELTAWRFSLSLIPVPKPSVLFFASHSFRQIFTLQPLISQLMGNLMICHNNPLDVKIISIKRKFQISQQ